MDEAPESAPLDLVTMLGEHVASRPDSTCLLFENQAISFADLGARTDRVAGALRTEGVKTGDRVAILAHSSPVFFELLLGCAKRGAIMVPINHRLSGREVDEILRDSEPSLLIVDPALEDRAPADGVMRRITTTGFAEWRDAAAASARSAAMPDEPVLILYTSGTTALPKGVVLSHRNLSYLGRMAGELWGFADDSVNLAAMPLFHIGGIGWGLLAFSQGGATVLTQATDPATLLHLMRRHCVTHAFLVPTVIQLLVDHLDATDDEAPRVANMFYGAAPIGEVLLARSIRAFGCAFHHTYGMTETAGTTVTLGPEDHDPGGRWPERLRSCGRPMPWIELKLVDPATDEECGVGEVGEIRMRSPAITRGYWRRPEATAEALTTDGWLCSGDAAVQDEDGYLYLRDRYKNMIVSGGENIYPAEIDNVLQHHPAIREVAVVGAPHPKWGETPHAYVVLEPGMCATEADIIGFVRERLAHYKCPTKVHFVEGLPRNASGKILKRELRE